ncbi:SSU0592/SSU0593 family protein [Streptococcus suis]|uniref:SSU0592/SSU0593 family protein n=1 Tax=Streptococcus suis TaxID=1307 RepID=UPI000400205C|nr:hypothetical protein [Streptococcus suis]HEM3232232.1 hypothetical protein [Streptococcus suis 2726]
MKQLVTKRSYKIGLSAMALVLLMTTAGGAVAHAESTLFFSPGGSETFISIEKSNIDNWSSGTIKTESLNQTHFYQEENESWYGKIWGGLKTFWNSWCCGFGLRGLKSK